MHWYTHTYTTILFYGLNALVICVVEQSKWRIHAQKDGILSNYEYTHTHLINLSTLNKCIHVHTHTHILTQTPFLTGSVARQSWGPCSSSVTLTNGLISADEGHGENLELATAPITPGLHRRTHCLYSVLLSAIPGLYNGCTLNDIIEFHFCVLFTMRFFLCTWLVDIGTGFFFTTSTCWVYLAVIGCIFRWSCL